MKSYIAAAALLAVVNAQSISDAPACVQTCVANMLGMAGSLGCSPTDAACLCANVNFGYGVRDCSQAICQNAADVQTGLQLLNSGYCASAASSASAAGSSVSSQSAVGSSVLAGVSSVAVSTEGSYTTITTDGSTVTSLVSASNTLYGFVTIGTDSAGSAFTSTITGTGAGAGAFVTTGTNSDGSTYTSTLTGDAASSAESAAASASSSASEGASSASESVSSAVSGASASASSVAASASSEASSRASSATSAAGSATSASSGGAAAPMITMAANGVVGLAGLAAVMLL